MFDTTQPTRKLDDLQPLQSIHVPKQKRLFARKRFWLATFVVLVLLYFFAPLRTNILLLGTDDSPERGAVGRTDTIILTTIVPLQPYVGMLSIPRDLWVNIPGVGEQRINTAYFFAEANQPGSGPRAATQTIRENFDISVRYYVLIHMTGLISAVDSLGGVEIQLNESTGGYPAGTHQLNGQEALAFVRDRSSSDDFSRMRRGQILIFAVIGKMFQPASWRDLPALVYSLFQVIDTNIPIWQLPRLLFALVRAPLFGVDSQTITRDMVTPFQTSGGAQVLAPNWEAIRPLLEDMFGKFYAIYQ
jgi:LCP family protein required for cell wall assembly